ncbi:hypothetical protein A2U01_0057692, partial [Trifolium medium]|nr:hypothetical protein [Trifolium medium]
HVWWNFCGGSNSNRHNIPIFCLWLWFRSLARRAAMAGATRSALVQRPFFLLESARRSAGAGAARSVVLFCSEFSSVVGEARTGSLRGAQLC